MSITMSPEAGCWTTCHYYVDADEPSGFYVAKIEEPSIGTRGSYELISQFQLAPADVIAEGEHYVGHVEAEAIKPLLERVSALSSTVLLSQFEQMLRHCLVHKCGLSWG